MPATLSDHCHVRSASIVFAETGSTDVFAVELSLEQEQQVSYYVDAMQPGNGWQCDMTHTPKDSTCTSKHFFHLNKTLDHLLHELVHTSSATTLKDNQPSKRSHLPRRLAIDAFQSSSTQKCHLYVPLSSRGHSFIIYNQTKNAAPTHEGPILFRPKPRRRKQHTLSARQTEGYFLHESNA